MARTLQGYLVLGRLEKLVLRRKMIDAEIAGAVAKAREAVEWGQYTGPDCTWGEIADALGVTRQAASEKYGSRKGSKGG